MPYEFDRNGDHNFSLHTYDNATIGQINNIYLNAVINWSCPHTDESSNIDLSVACTMGAGNHQAFLDVHWSTPFHEQQNCHKNKDTHCHLLRNSVHITKLQQKEKKKAVLFIPQNLDYWPNGVGRRKDRN
jgi:hypothetical protein